MRRVQTTTTTAATATRRLMGIALAALTIATGGLGCSAMKNGSMASVTPVTTTQPRVGSVYLLRGWIGIFSTGIDKLGDELTAAGVHSQVYQEAQWSSLANTIIAKYEGQPNHEPIVIVGHSYGADDSILITRKLAEKNIKVDLVVTLDPVTPRKVPANIGRVYNLYQSSALDGLPFLRGIPLTPDSPGPVALENMNIRKDRTDLLDQNLDHFNIEKKEKIHADVIAQVLKACPPRATWVATKASITPVASANPGIDPSGIDLALANRPSAPAAVSTAAPAAGVAQSVILVTSTFAPVETQPREVATANVISIDSH